jgi:hypothetical protein
MSIARSWEVQMKHAVFLLVLLAAGAMAVVGSVRLETPVIVGGTDQILQYDDGSAWWCTWGGLYRGVWFDVTDFDMDGYGFIAEYTEFWFYHMSDSPWDTDQFYAELWNGEASGPVTRLDQTSMIATHYAPVYANYSPTIETEANFWTLVYTRMSSGGWPSTIGDNTPNPTNHSFTSDNFFLWEPWTASANDLFIRAGGDLLSALETESWGSIKLLYR